MEKRVSRLDRRSQQKANLTRKASLDLGSEVRTGAIFAGLCLITGTALLVLLEAGLIEPESDLRIMLSFSLGILLTCMLSSTLAFTIMLRHRLLLIAAASVLTIVGAIMIGLTPLEGVAKIIFATSLGLWISLILTSIAQVLLVSVLIVVVDFYSVFLGPTRKMVESGGPWIDYLTINMPVFGASASSRIGIADIIFFSIFVGCTLTWRLRRTTTALALTLSFVGTMIVGVRLDAGVPALPLLSTFFILSNADLLYRRYLDEPDEQRRNHSGG